MSQELPKALQEAIEAEVESTLKDLTSAREELTERYRKSGHKGPFMTTELQRQAYLSARMPATYGAVHSVLQAIRERIKDMPIHTFLDLGSGPGTGLWAACETFPSIQKAVLIENDRSLAKWGQRLAQHSLNSVIQQAQWQYDNLEELPCFPQHDMLLFSYSIGELAADLIPKVVEKSWNAAQQLLIVIEPGTPVGFERIRAIRRQLIEMGAFLVAPCPHHASCPMTGGDWCHFSARVERNAFHRRLKGGSLSYEDEKFSYVAAAKTPCDLPPARILRHPMHRSGHSIFTLCTEQGVKQSTISKREEEYKAARKWEWGDVFPLIPK
ncbi:MAG: hypothetical protein H0V82_05655 [Candidatus Protochlamydia sp.]|nr:hypothetical protein [Candidatus Protochlamydia sp.]